MNPIGYPKLRPVGSDLAPYERRSDRSGSQRELTCNRADRSECFVGPTLSRSTRSRGVDRARADRLHTLVGMWKQAAVCTDLSPIMIRGLEPNLRRVKLPNREKSLCFLIDVHHRILRKMAFSYRGLRTFAVLSWTDI